MAHMRLLNKKVERAAFKIGQPIYHRLALIQFICVLIQPYPATATARLLGHILRKERAKELPLALRLPAYPFLLQLQQRELMLL